MDYMSPKAKKRPALADPIAAMQRDNTAKSNQEKFTDPKRVSQALKNSAKRKMNVKLPATFSK